MFNKLARPRGIPSRRYSNAILNCLHTYSLYLDAVGSEQKRRGRHQNYLLYNFAATRVAFNRKRQGTSAFSQPTEAYTIDCTAAQRAERTDFKDVMTSNPFIPN